MRDFIHTHFEDASQRPLVHPSLVQLCSNSPQLIEVVVIGLQNDPERLVSLVRQVTECIPKTVPIVTAYAEGIQQAANRCHTEAHVELLEIANNLHKSISEPLTDLLSLFPAHEASKVLSFMSVNQDGSDLERVSHTLKQGTCLVAEITLEYRNLPSKVFYLKHNCTAELEVLAALASCQRGPTFLKIERSSPDSDVLQYDTLMPFEGPEISKCDTVTPETGFDAGLALAQMHSLGISHCDLAPWHIRARPDGTVFFIDFSNHLMFSPDALDDGIRDIKLQKSIVADVEDLVSLVEYLPTAMGLEAKRACQHAYRSTDFYRRLLISLVNAHQYTYAQELCLILDSDEGDRSLVQQQQDLALESLTDSIVAVTHQRNPELPSAPDLPEVRVSALLHGQTCDIEVSFTSGQISTMYLRSPQPLLDITTSDNSTIASFVQALVLKLSTDSPLRRQLEALHRSLLPKKDDWLR